MPGMVFRMSPATITSSASEQSHDQQYVLAPYHFRELQRRVSEGIQATGNYLSMGHQHVAQQQNVVQPPQLAEMRPVMPVTEPYLVPQQPQSGDPQLQSTTQQQQHAGHQPRQLRPRQTQDATKSPDDVAKQRGRPPRSKTPVEPQRQRLSQSKSSPRPPPATRRSASQRRSRVLRVDASGNPYEGPPLVESLHGAIKIPESFRYSTAAAEKKMLTLVEKECMLRGEARVQKNPDGSACEYILT